MIQIDKAFTHLKEKYCANTEHGCPGPVYWELMYTVQYANMFSF